MRLYLSGKMGGVEDFNFPAFHENAKTLRDSGYTVINPAENWGGEQSVKRAWCMRQDIQQVLLVDGIAVIDGWLDSPGARLEIDIAKAIEIPVHTVDFWLVAFAQYPEEWLQEDESKVLFNQEQAIREYLDGTK